MAVLLSDGQIRRLRDLSPTGPGFVWESKNVERDCTAIVLMKLCLAVPLFHVKTGPASRHQSRRTVTV